MVYLKDHKEFINQVFGVDSKLTRAACAEYSLVPIARKSPRLSVGATSQSLSRQLTTHPAHHHPQLPRLLRPLLLAAFPSRLRASRSIFCAGYQASTSGLGVVAADRLM